MKETIIKSVTALLCVVALCITSSSVVGKYSDAIKESAKLGAATQSDAAVGGGAFEGGNTLDPSAPVDPSAPTDPADPSAPTDPADPSAPDGANKPASNDPTKYTKAQIVNYYNTSLNNSYKKKVTIKRSETISITVDSIKPGGKAVTAIANKIVEAYAKTTETQDTFTNGQNKDKTGSPEGLFAPAKLNANGAKTATVKKVGANYEVNIVVVKETATLERFPVYNKQCSYPLDLASVDLFGVEIVKADFVYDGTVLKAVVDPQGRVLSASVYMPLKGTGAGKFGFTIEANVHGSFTRTATFKYL